MDDIDRGDSDKGLPRLLTEKEVIKRWPNVFGTRSLRRARQNGELEFYDFERGPRYSEAQLAQYLKSKIVRAKPKE